MVSLLIQHAAHVVRAVNRAVSPHGRTPLHAACEGGFAEVVDELLGANAEVDKADRKSPTLDPQPCALRHTPEALSPDPSTRNPHPEREFLIDNLMV